MEMKRMEIYFGKAKSLPIAMSIAEVSQLISAKGVTSPPKKSWWNLNNFIIMTTSILLISAALLTFQPLPFNGEEKAYEPSATLPSFAQLSDYQLEPVNGVYSRMRPPNSQQTLPSTMEVEKKQDSTDEQPVSPLNSVAKVPLLVDGEPVVPTEPIAPAAEMEEPEVSNLGGDFEGKSKTITKEFDIGGITTLDISHRNGDVNIETWDQEKIEVSATFTVKTENPEHEVLALNDFDISLSPVGTKAVIASTWDELNNCACTSSRTTAPKKGLLKFLYFSSDDQTNKAKTNSGEEFEYENFKIVYTIKIPKKLNVDVSNKYANVTVQEIDGNLDATLFRGNVVAHNVGGDLDLTVKYGNSAVGNYHDASVTLFRSELELGNGNQLNLKANYSEVQLQSTAELNVDAFRSNVTASSSVNEVEGSFKYGDLTIGGHVKKAELSLFRSNLRGKTFGQLDMSAAYSSLVANQVNELTLDEAFRTDVDVKEVGSLNGNLKYSNLDISLLNKKVDVTAFRGELAIELIQADFLSVEVNSKYTHVELSFSPQSKYDLNATTTYTDFNFPDGISDLKNQNQAGAQINHFVGIFNKGNTKKSSPVNVETFHGVLKLN